MSARLTAGYPYRAVLLAALAVLPLAPAAPLPRPDPAPERDWPMFGGTPARNMANPFAKGLPEDWCVEQDKERNLRWAVDLGGHARNPPAISGGKVFVPTDNERPRDPAVKGARAVLMCFRETDGKFLWQLAHDLPAGPLVCRTPGPALLSTPAVEGNRLYYLTPAAEVVCADTDGKVVWQTDLSKGYKVRPYLAAGSSPLVAGDLVFLVTGNGRDPEDERKPVPEPKAPSFVALRKKTGAVAWADSSPGADIMQAQWGSPAYAEVNGRPQVIFPGGDGWLYAFEPATGELLWKFDCNPRGAEFKLGGNGNRNYFLAAPVVSGNSVYVGTGQNPGDGIGEGHLWCIDATKRGDISPELATGKPNPNSGAVWHYGGRSPAGAEREWVFGRTASTCAIQGGLVYAAELNGYLHCLDARTGKPYWVADLKAEVRGSPLWADGRVYVGTEDGSVFVFAHGKERKQLGMFDVNEAVFAPAVAANGVLYLTTDRRLYAIGSREKAKP